VPGRTDPFPVSGGRLAASLDPTPELSDRFRAACRALLESAEPELTVDLSRARRISSANMSYLVTLHFDARDRGKRLAVLISAPLMEAFRRTHLVDLVGMDIRGPAGERPGPGPAG
jgi:hypothetical protein